MKLNKKPSKNKYKKKKKKHALTRQHFYFPIFHITAVLIECNFMRKKTLAVNLVPKSQ